MRLEEFFDKFELFAEAPNAVAKMRELVFELAVRGKLAEQLKEDVNTLAWRNFVAEQPKVRDLEQPFLIPRSWIWVTLNDLGNTKPKNTLPDEETVSFVPMASIADTYGTPVKPEVRKWKEIKKGYTHFADGDVVLAKITPCYENGKSAVIEHLTGGVGAGTTELHVFRPSTEVVMPKYVHIYLKSRGFIERGIPRMTGSAGQKRVPHDYFANSAVPLPPPAEQKRIVAKLDELMALCDRLEAQQQQRATRHAALARASLARFAADPTPANLEYLFHESYAITPADLRKTILTLAVQGKLVPQDVSDEPASMLLKRIKDEKTRLIDEGKIKKQKPLDGLGKVENSYDLPQSWAWTRFGEIAFQITDGTHHTPTYLSEGVPFLSVKDMSTGKLDFSDTRYISMEQHQELIKRCFPEKGDLLLTKVGTTGIPVLIDTASQFSIFVSVALIKFPQDMILGSYLSLLVNSPLVKAQSEEGTEGVGNKNLVLRKIAAFVLAIPPLNEQIRIVAKVEQLMALVDQLEVQLTASHATAEKLMEALVAELTTSAQRAA